MHDSRLRLALVTDYGYPAGGIEHVVRELLSHTPDDIECSLLTWTDSVLRPDSFDNVSTIEFGDVRRAWSVLEAADVVMVHTSFNVRLLARLVVDFLNLVNKPSICVVHTSGHSDPSASSTSIQTEWLRSLTVHSTATVAVSSQVAVALQRAGAEPKELHVIENGARFKATRVERGSRKVVSFIGRPFPQKGYDTFLRLVADLSPTHPRLTFMANTVSVQVPPRTGLRTTYMLDDTDFVSFLSATDLLVVPYRTADGLPLAVLEALNCGIPTIGLDAPGVGELLRRHGQMVVSDYPDLKSAVARWHTGQLTVSPPESPDIPGWDVATTAYFDLTRRLRNAHV